MIQRIAKPLHHVEVQVAFNKQKHMIQNDAFRCWLASEQLK